MVINYLLSGWECSLDLSSNVLSYFKKKKKRGEWEQKWPLILIVTSYSASSDQNI